MSILFLSKSASGPTSEEDKKSVSDSSWGVHLQCENESRHGSVSEYGWIHWRSFVKPRSSASQRDNSFTRPNPTPSYCNFSAATGHTDLQVRNYKHTVDRAALSPWQMCRANELWILCWNPSLILAKALQKIQFRSYWWQGNLVVDLSSWSARAIRTTNSTAFTSWIARVWGAGAELSATCWKVPGVDWKQTWK